MSIIKRFPSYDQIISGAGAAVVRFPFTLFSALVGVVVTMIMVGPNHSTEHSVLEKVLACAALGLPLFTVLTIFAEKRGWSQVGRLLLQAVGLVLLVAYYFSLPEKISEPTHHLMRLALLQVGLHFLVAWLPWTGKDQLVGFWEYNKALFLRFLISALYSAVLYLGLALALVAVDQLFGAEIMPERYFQLWVLIAGLFNTWVFLAGVPKDLEALNRGGEYPSGLKAFTQFILLPLVGLYFAILVAYEAKIIITWNWPKGWVSELVLWYSVVGILSLLLLHPLRERSESRWIPVMSKWFYRGLIPLVAMLFLAIMRRISEYGVTENRYLVLVMAVGLVAVMLYMVVSKRKDVRIIPFVICFMALLSTYGPWSAMAVSRGSQQARLESLLVKNGIWQNDMIQKPTVVLSLEDRKEMSSAVVYLDQFHGMEAFSDWLADSTRQTLDTLPRYDRAEQLTEKLGFAYTPPGEWSTDNVHLQLDIGDQRATDVVGYEYMIRIEGMGASRPTIDFTIDQDSCRLEYDTTAVSLALRFRGASADTNSVAVIPLKESLMELIENTSTDKLTPQDLSFSGTSAQADVKAVLDLVGGRRTEDGLEIHTLNGFLLVHRH